MSFTVTVREVAHYMRPLAAMTAFFSHGAIAGLLLLVSVIHYYSHDLPDYDQLAEYDPAITTRLYAGDRRLLAEYATE